MAQDKSKDISILKSLWRKNASGAYVIHGIKGIDLNPREGFEADYFKIKDEMVLLTETPGAIFENIFSTFGFTEFLVRQSIVPIVAWNEGDQEIRCIGTGFFISASGLLLTAAHVIRDPVDEQYVNLTQVADNAFKFDKSLNVGVMLPANPAMKTAPSIFGVRDEIREAKSFIAPIEWAQHWGQEVLSPLFHMKPEYKLDLDIAVCKVKENAIGGSY
jgi:hypothetical protein